MADEIEVRRSLQIKKGSLDWPGIRPTQFNADLTVTDPYGPTPGVIDVTTAGVDVSLSELTTPGWCTMVNLDPTNYVSVGIWDGTAIFFPLLELLPGKPMDCLLARDLGEEYGTGTGTTAVGNNTLRLKANTATCKVAVMAFER